MRRDQLNEEERQEVCRHADVLRRLPLRPIFTRWAMEKEIGMMPVGAGLSLLLPPLRKASPAASVGAGQIALLDAARVLGPIEALPTSCLEDRGAGVQHGRAGL